MDWMGLALDMEEWRTLVKTVINFWVNFGKSLNNCVTGGFSRRPPRHGAIKLVT
jgi:hypothetical protein